METVEIDVLEDVLKNLNTWLVVLIVGVVMWITRQIMPDKIEATKLWSILLRIIPLVLGIAIALIPGLRPVEGNLAQSGAIGFIGGSFAQSVYGLIRSVVNARMKAMIGSRQERKSLLPNGE